MVTDMSVEIELLIKKVATNKNISLEDAKFFFDMGFYEGRISGILGAIK